MDILLRYNRGHAWYFCFVSLFRSVGCSAFLSPFISNVFLFSVFFGGCVFHNEMFANARKINLIIWPDDSDCRIPTAIPHYRNLESINKG